MGATLDEFEHGEGGERTVILAGEDEEIGEGETTPGGTEESEPCGSIRGVEQGAGKGEKVKDFVAFVELLDADSTVGNGAAGALTVEGADDLQEVGAVADQDGDAPGLTGGMRAGAPLLDDTADFGCKALGLAAMLRDALRGGHEGEAMQVPDAAGTGGGEANGLCGGVGDDLGVGGVGLAGEDEAEVAVERLDEVALGTEVGGEVEDAEGDGVGAGAERVGMHGVDETFDAGLAEEVDGLLGVAD